MKRERIEEAHKDIQSQFMANKINKNNEWVDLENKTKTLLQIAKDELGKNDELTLEIKKTIRNIELD